MSFLDRLRGLFGATTVGATTANGGPEMISCDDALRLVHEYLDGELENVSQAEVEAHFEACQRCYPHLRLERSFRQAVRRVATRETAPPELAVRLRELISEVGSEG